MAHILVVDDEEQIRRFLNKALVQKGHTVEEASDGEQALVKFAYFKPDLIITDILMPVKGGLSLIKDIKSTNPDQKIIAISGGGRDGKLCFLSTAKTFKDVLTLKKPFEVEELTGALSALLASADDR